MKIKKNGIIINLTIIIAFFFFKSTQKQSHQCDKGIADYAFNLYILLYHCYYVYLTVSTEKRQFIAYVSSLALKRILDIHKKIHSRNNVFNAKDRFILNRLTWLQLQFGYNN